MFSEFPRIDRNFNSMINADNPRQAFIRAGFNVNEQPALEPDANAGIPASPFRALLARNLPLLTSIHCAYSHAGHFRFYGMSLGIYLVLGITSLLISTNCFLGWTYPYNLTPVNEYSLLLPLAMLVHDHQLHRIKCR